MTNQSSLFYKRDVKLYLNNIKRATIILLVLLCIFTVLSPFISLFAVNANSTPTSPTINVDDAIVSSDGTDVIHSTTKMSLSKAERNLLWKLLSNNQWKGKRSYISGALAQYRTTMYTGDKFQDIVQNWITFNTSEMKVDYENQGGYIPVEHQSYFQKIWIPLSIMYTGITHVAVLLMVLYFLIELAGKATAEQFNLEVMFKMLLKLVIGYIIIRNLMVISTPGDNMKTPLILSVVNFFSGLGNISMQVDDIAIPASALVETVSLAQSHWAHWGSNAVAIIPYTIICLILELAMYAVCIGRLIELAILCLFSPIGVANFFNGSSGSRSSAIRYFKKIAAVALQGAILTAICIAVSNFVAGNTVGQTFINIGTLFAAVSMMAKSKSIAQEIIG